MENLITLDHFKSGSRHFHIRKPDPSSVSDRIHYHDYYQMLYVVSGELKHEHEGRTLSLFAGDAFIIPPMFTHRLVFATPKAEIYSLAFSADLFHAGFSQSNVYGFLTSLSHGGNGEEDIHLRIRLSGAQQEIFGDLMKCLMKEQEACPVGAYSAVPSLISSSLNILAQSYCSEETTGAETGNRKAVRDLIRYLDNHYTEELPMELLLREFGLSRSSLCALFAEYTGLTVKKYVRNKRIMKAEAMLRADPRAALSEVAASVGYPESSTFFRNFTAVVGVSPSRYRGSYQ